MKINFLLYIIAAFLCIVSCTKDYDAPPLIAPEYNGNANLTIKELKEIYANVSDPTLIEVDYVVKGYVVGNDISGNIYKQLYVQDETGALNIGIDQNSISATHRVGQEVYIRLHQLYMLKYGGELQLGYGDTNANRIPWEIFTAHVNFNGFPNVSKVKPTVVTIDKLTDDLVNSLIQIDNVYFVNGGKETFTINDNTTEQAVKDANGNTLNVRTSSFSNFANDSLPSGYGTIIGIIGRYNNAWQFTLRDTDDLVNFTGSTTPPTNPGGDEEIIMYETFGDGNYPSGSRPKIAEFTDFQAPAPISYADRSGRTDIRSSASISAHAWFPAPNAQGDDAYLTITNINTSACDNPELSFQLAANVYQPTDQMNLNAMSVTVNGTALTIPSTPVSGANGDDGKFYTFTFDIPSVENMTVEFHTGTANTYGLRLDNIKIAAKSSTIIVR